MNEQQSNHILLINGLIYVFTITTDFFRFVSLMNQKRHEYSCKKQNEQKTTTCSKQQQLVYMLLMIYRCGFAG